MKLAEMCIRDSHCIDSRLYYNKGIYRRYDEEYINNSYSDVYKRQAAYTSAKEEYVEHAFLVIQTAMHHAGAHNSNEVDYE